MKKLVVLLFISLLLSSCAGHGIVVRPDVYVSGNFAPPRWHDGPYYGPFWGYWGYSVLTVINGSRYELEIIQDGIKKGGRISPGAHLRLLIKNYYNESRQVSMVAVAYYGSRLAGTTTRTFYFYGSSYSRQSETWQITD